METEGSASDAASSPHPEPLGAVKRSSLVEIEDEGRCLPPDGHAACLWPLRRLAESIDCEMAGDQIYSIISLEERNLPSHALACTHFLPITSYLVITARLNYWLPPSDRLFQ